MWYRQVCLGTMHIRQSHLRTWRGLGPLFMSCWVLYGTCRWTMGQNMWHLRMCTRWTNEIIHYFKLPITPQIFLARNNSLYRSEQDSATNFFFVNFQSNFLPAWPSKAKTGDSDVILGFSDDLGYLHEPLVVQTFAFFSWRKSFRQLEIIRFLKDGIKWWKHRL